MTNFEKIKSMGIEEMAEFLDCCMICKDWDTDKFFLDDRCIKKKIRWLESEVQE